jgi:hypothetical protein
MNNAKPIAEVPAKVDSDLAAAAEVEDGIRDFVRNDIAYLRRSNLGSSDSNESVPVETPEAVVNNVNFFDPACRRDIDRRNRKFDFRTAKLARLTAR